MVGPFSGYDGISERSFSGSSRSIAESAAILRRVKRAGESKKAKPALMMRLSSGCHGSGS
jgi:hypothetical protein